MVEEIFGGIVNPGEKTSTGPVMSDSREDKGILDGSDELVVSLLNRSRMNVSSLGPWGMGKSAIVSVMLHALVVALLVVVFCRQHQEASGDDHRLSHGHRLAGREGVLAKSHGSCRCETRRSIDEGDPQDTPRTCYPRGHQALGTQDGESYSDEQRCAGREFDTLGITGRTASDTEPWRHRRRTRFARGGSRDRSGAYRSGHKRHWLRNRP